MDVRTLPRNRQEASTAPAGLLLMLCAQFMVMLDASIVTVAVPHIQSDLRFSPVGVQSVITAYNTAFGGTLILCGRVGDLLGRRRVFTAGMVAFAVTSLACGVAQNAAELVAARALQGLSAALIAPTALSLLTTSVPEGPQRIKAMSKFGMATVLGFVSGVVLSGLLVRMWGWRSVFFVTVPVGLAVAALAPRLISHAPRLPHRIDAIGAVLVSAGMALIVAAPAQGVSSGWGSWRFLLLAGLGLALLTIFCRYELRAPEPLVRLGLFRSPVLRAANLVSVFSGVSSGSAYLLATMYFQQVHGLTPLEAGLIVAPVGVLNISFGLVISRLIARLGLRTSITAATVTAGALIAAVASQVSAHGSVVIFGLVLLPMGMAFLATTVTSTLAATSGVADHEQGLAAGVRQTSFQLGIALGVAVLIPVATSRLSKLGSSASVATRHAVLAHGIQSALYVLALLVATAGVLAYAGLRRL